MGERDTQKFTSLELAKHQTEEILDVYVVTIMPVIQTEY